MFMLVEWSCRRSPAFVIPRYGHVGHRGRRRAGIAGDSDGERSLGDLTLVQIDQ